MFERLADADREFIKSKVQAGYYTSEIEVVRDAIRKMREEDERLAQMNALRELIMVGHRQALAGEVVEYTEDFLERAMKKALENQAKGAPIKDDIKP